MGNCAPYKPRREARAVYERPSSNSNQNNPLSDSEIQSRIDACKDSVSLNIAGISLRYAWVSQRGYYPDALDKDNQDTYVVINNFGNKKTAEQCFFGIFDGHGKDGHLCARYARDHLPRNIADALDQAATSPAQLTPALIKKALTTAHTSTNAAMHHSRKFDDTLSGTTAISVFFRGRTMYISNVGDSRAIIISEVQGGSNSTEAEKNGQRRLVASPLSSDQTPYRKDERERIKARGARIMSMDQIEGVEPFHENWGDLNLGEDIDEGGDPPRVWSANGDYPGTAFTRSLGDRVAEDCGVNAEPEILERPLFPQDQYLVIASDGVFEFLTNQMVADELSRHKDPLMACKAVVQSAYNMWLQYEVRTDDITIIAMYLDHIPRPASFSISSSFYNPEDANVSATGSTSALPGAVIGAGTSGKTGFISNGGALSPTVASAANTTATVGNGSSGKFGFEVAGSESKPVRRVMSREKRKRIIELQRSYAYDDEDDEEDEEQGAIKSAASSDADAVKSDEDVAMLTSAIKSNFLFQHLNSAQRAAVISVMKQLPVKAGDRIIKQGERGDKFYVLSDGRLEVRVKLPPSLTPTKSDDGDSFSMTLGKSARVDRSPSTESMVLKDEKGRTLSSTDLVVERPPAASAVEKERDPDRLGTVVHVYESGPNQHPGFGELSLMYGKPRAASIIALEDGKLWSLDRKTFQKVVLRPKNMRSNVIKLLLTLEVFQCMNFTQLQRVTDLLSEMNFKAGQIIEWPEGHQGGNFFLVLRGECECKVRSSSDSVEVIRLKENDCYGDQTLMGQMQDSLVESKVGSGDRRSRNCISSGADDDLLEAKAVTDVRLLYMGKAAFEGVFGPLATVAEKTRRRRTTMKLYEGQVPRDFESEIGKKAVVGTDTMGHLLLGSFRSEKPNVTVWSFILSAVEKKCLDDSLVRFIDAAKALLLDDASSSPLLAAPGTVVPKYSAMVPSFMSFMTEANAVHVVFDTPVITDLSALIRSHNEEASMNASVVSYTTACVVSALERLHSLNIVYRAVQPESLYVDASGHVVLMDFRVCKIGIDDHSKTYTVCGASDYLAPEQVSQVGHSYPVDMWGLGVLLYELSVGSHPFSSASEVATYTRITSFGSKNFPALTFPDYTPADVRSLINQLLTPLPEARIGAGVNGFSALKSHPFLSRAFPDWEVISSGGEPSPLMDMVRAESAQILAEGVDASILQPFTKEYKGWEERKHKWEEIIDR